MLKIDIREESKEIALVRFLEFCKGLVAQHSYDTITEIKGFIRHYMKFMSLSDNYIRIENSRSVLMVKYRDNPKTQFVIYRSDIVNPTEIIEL